MKLIAGNDPTLISLWALLKILCSTDKKKKRKK